MSAIDIVSAVSLRLDESAGAVFFTAQQIYDALNESLLMTEAAGKWNPASVSLSLTAHADLVALPTTTIFIPQYILIGGLKYFVTTHAKLEQYDRQWKSTTRAQPTHFVLWDASHLRCFPSPDITYTATLWGLQWPSEVTSIANHSPDLPLLLQESIVYRACGELLEHTHPPLADEYNAKADEYLNAFKVQLRKRQPHNISRLRPASPFQVGQSGDIAVGRLANQHQNYQS